MVEQQEKSYDAHFVHISALTHTCTHSLSCSVKKHPATSKKQFSHYYRLSFRFCSASFCSQKNAQSPSSPPPSLSHSTPYSQHLSFFFFFRWTEPIPKTRQTGVCIGSCCLAGARQLCKLVRHIAKDIETDVKNNKKDHSPSAAKGLQLLVVHEIQCIRTLFQEAVDSLHNVVGLEPLGSWRGLPRTIHDSVLHVLGDTVQPM